MSIEEIKKIQDYLVSKKFYIDYQYEHTDLVIETNYSITSYNERYVVCWGIY